MSEEVYGHVDVGRGIKASGGSVRDGLWAGDDGSLEMFGKLSHHKPKIS